MAKRKYSVESDEGSEYEDTSPKKSRPFAVKKAKKKNNGPSSRVDVDKEDSGAPLEQHPISRHSIRSAAPICSALLDWYAGVRESRGMPWRKPYDPSLGRDGRAQRAYEVKTLMFCHLYFRALMIT